MIEPLRILIVDDSPVDREVYKRLLMKNTMADYVFAEVESGIEAVQNCKDALPDCILLDYNLPELDGLEFLSEISREIEGDLPAVVMLTGQGNESVAVEAMKNGAEDYLIKSDITGETLQRSINNAIEKTELRHLLKLREAELKRRAVTDDLTGLYSRRYTMEHLDEEKYRADRYGVPFCVAMLDLDHFKEINDQHGHPLGDKVLRSFSKILSKCTRKLDIVGRYGGEEFIVILPNTPLEGAQVVVHRILETGKRQTFKGSDGAIFHVTCSIGLSAYEPKMKDTAVLIESADRALYEAKHHGRDRVCIGTYPVVSECA